MSTAVANIAPAEANKNTPPANIANAPAKPSIIPTTIAPPGPNAESNPATMVKAVTKPTIMPSITPAAISLLISVFDTIFIMAPIAKAIIDIEPAIIAKAAPAIISLPASMFLEFEHIMAITTIIAKTITENKPITAAIPSTFLTLPNIKTRPAIAAAIIASDAAANIIETPTALSLEASFLPFLLEAFIISPKAVNTTPAKIPNDKIAPKLLSLEVKPLCIATDNPNIEAAITARDEEAITIVTPKAFICSGFIFPEAFDK